MKVGILGYGSIGKRHFENAYKHLGHTALWYDPAVPGSEDRETVLSWADAIVVASPSQCHAADLMEAINRGKSVLVEKPIGYDCPAYIDAFLQGARLRWKPNLIVATGFNLRFHYCVRFVKRMLELNGLGPLKAASFTVNQRTEKPPYLRDGIIRNWMSHEIDLAHHLLGDGTVAFATAPLDDSGRDTISCWIRMEFPAVEQAVYLQGDYFTEPEQRFFWIEGEKGSIYCNLVQRQVMMRMRGENPKLIYTGPDTWDHNYRDEMNAFLMSVDTGQHHKFLATGEDGVRALYTVMAARKAAGLKD